MMADVFGPLLAPWNVERAVLSVLEERLPAYLANIEEKNGFQRGFLGRPPDPESYKGGLDWQSVRQEWLPAVVVVANPQGEPERNAETYIQEWAVEVGCVVLSDEGTDPEGAARMRAGLMAAATMLLAQHGGLKGFAVQETVLTGAPRVEFFDEEQRRSAVGITTWQVFSELLRPNAGPVTVKEVEPEGPYPPLPEAKTETVKVVGEPLATPL